MGETTVYLALGSNLGDRRANLAEALRRLGALFTIEQVSSVYETEPAYVTDQPRFLNLVLRAQVDSTRWPPAGLLRALKGIERGMGRQSGVRYGPRPIDIDILLYGQEQIKDADLVIPHPGLPERAFVLVPLAEIAPDLRVPGQAEPVAALAARAGALGSVLRAEPLDDD